MYELVRLADLLNYDGLGLLVNMAKSLSVSHKYRANKINFNEAADKAIAMANGDWKEVKK